LLYHVKDKFELDKNNQFDAHVFFNEKSKIDQKQVILEKIIGIHDKIKVKKFSSKKEFEAYKKTEISANFREYFRWNRFNKTIERNNKAIEKTLTRLGTFVIATNQGNLEKEQVLNYYRRKDTIEKMFDIFKNELETDRLRVHSQTNTEGKLFIKFITLILYCKIAKTLKENDLFKKFTVREVFAELRKIRKTTLKGEKSITSELNKRHKQIFEAFKLNYNLT
jgi:transposase